MVRMTMHWVSSVTSWLDSKDEATMLVEVVAVLSKFVSEVRRAHGVSSLLCFPPCPMFSSKSSCGAPFLSTRGLLCVWGGTLPGVGAIGGRFRLDASAEVRARADGTRGVPLVCAARVLNRLSGCVLKGLRRPSCVAISLYPSARMLVPCVSVDCTGLCAVFCAMPGASLRPGGFVETFPRGRILFFLPEKCNGEGFGYQSKLISGSSV